MKTPASIRKLLKAHGITITRVPAKNIPEFQNRLDSFLRMRKQIYTPAVKGSEPEAELSFRKRKEKA